MVQTSGKNNNNKVGFSLVLILKREKMKFFAVDLLMSVNPLRSLVGIIKRWTTLGSRLVWNLLFITHG